MPVRPDSQRSIPSRSIPARSIPARSIPTRTMLLAVGASLTLAAAAPTDARPSSDPNPPALRAVIHDGAEVVQSFRVFLDEIGYADSALRNAIESDNAEFNQALFAFDAIARGAGLTPWEAVGVLTGRRIDLTMDIPADGGSPAFVAVVHLDETDAADRLLLQVHQLVGVANRRGRLNPAVVRTIDEVDFIPIGEDGVLQGRIDRRLIIGNDTPGIRRAIANQADAPPAASPDLVATLDVDLRVVRAATGADFDDRDGDPLGVMIVGGWRRMLQQADHATLTLTRVDRGVRISSNIEHAGPWPASHRGFLAPAAPSRTWTTASMPDIVGEIAIRRDWASLFSEREMLMSLPAASQLTGFASGASTLFGRLDFVDDLLAKVDGPVRVIASMPPEASDDDPTPVPLLPSLMLTAPLPAEDAAEFALRIRSAASTAISIVGLEQAQQDQPALLLDVDRIGDTRVVLGTYPGDARPELPGVQFNFEPAVAYAGSDLFIASNPTIFRHALTAAGADDARDIPGDAAWVDVDRLADLFRLNRDSLIMNRMLQENETRDEAIAFTELLDAMLRPFDRLDATVVTNDASMTVEITATFDGESLRPETTR